eukprot:CAMPEP_0206464376 /NCGR_PEP_ID=MMETSP0324_2-20121206/27180_1 /ASSEMBLY_ACC=CAM_ASM_000836 /TAXON_ID=2866 /ORGANISM="Crypthecodinium cohnii, Strain Seligo" /LENGTH=59 /DNA_ID=CAMNT_0053936997 /DNA_START=182 /DNA_END=361 /DNA_ORIENTATION=+
MFIVVKSAGIFRPEAAVTSSAAASAKVSPAGSVAGEEEDPIMAELICERMGIAKRKRLA